MNLQWDVAISTLKSKDGLTSRADYRERLGNSNSSCSNAVSTEDPSDSLCEKNAPMNLGRSSPITIINEPRKREHQLNKPSSATGFQLRD